MRTQNTWGQTTCKYHTDSPTQPCHHQVVLSHQPTPNHSLPASVHNTSLRSSTTTFRVPALSGSHFDGNSAAEGELWRSIAQLTMDSEKSICKGLWLYPSKKCFCSPTQAVVFTTMSQENNSTWPQSHVHGFRSPSNAASLVFKWPNTR